MSQSVEVLPVKRGSIVVLEDVEIPAGQIDAFVAELTKGIGHSEFALLQIHSGSKVRILQAPEELVDLIRERTAK